MPSVTTRPGLQIKGFDPYASARLNTGSSQPFTPPAPATQPTQASTFSTLDSYQPSAAVADPYNRTSVEAQNISYRLLNNDLNIKIPYAQLDLVDRTPEDAMYLEGLDFNLHLKAGQVKVSDVDVSITLGHMLEQQKLPVKIKDIRVVFDPNNQLRVEGKVSKFGLTVPFQVNGTFGATPKGEFTYQMGRVSVMGVSVNGIMKTFGLSLEKVLKLNDPAKGYYAVGNSVYLNPNRVLEQPGIHVNLQNARSHLGDLELTFGDSPEQVSAVQQELKTKRLNGLEISGGHFYYDGYFIKDGNVRMEDKTPDTPLQMEKTGETIMNLQRGFVGVTNPKFAEIIAGKLGEDSSLKNASTRLKSNAAELKGSMWGFIPLKLDLAFGRTTGGQLMFTPQNAKAVGFIPLPDSLIRKQVQKMVEGGVPYQNGVALPSLGDTHLGYLKQVSHQAGFLILEAGSDQ